MQTKFFCPKKLCNSLANLSELFAATIGEDDVYPHVRLEGPRNPGE